MKLINKIFIVFVILIILFTALIFMEMSKVANNINKTLDAINYLEINKVEDGIYFGEKDTPLVKVSVKVSVINHTLESIEIIRHENGIGKKAENIVNDMLEHNKIDVDDVAGASLSSKVIKVAVNNALSQGLIK